jgi:hypothetical protein
MSDDDARMLAPKIIAFKHSRGGRLPMLNAEDKEEKLLAQAHAYLTARKAQWLREKQAKDQKQVKDL